MQLETKLELFKHALFESSWMWNHPPCRIEAKAIARCFSMIHGHYQLIPISPITPKEFRQIADLELLPGKFTPSGCGYDHFEDRVLKPNESPHATETNEIDQVINNLNNNGFTDTSPKKSLVSKHSIL